MCVCACVCVCVWRCVDVCVSVVYECVCVVYECVCDCVIVNECKYRRTFEMSVCVIV